MYTTNKIETFKPAYRQGYEPSRTHLIFCLLISSLFYLTAFANVASGATYYLDAAATGANNGTSWTDAWQSASDAAAGLYALADNGSGDTVIVGTGDYGTYTENGVIRTDWCTFQAAPGADVNFTYLDIRNGSYGSAGDSYLKFDGIDIVQSTGNCVSLKYCNYFEITNCLMEPDYVTIGGASEDWYIWINQIGIRAIQASHVSLDNVTISRCAIGVHITNEGGGTNRGHDWSITNSYFGPLAAIAIYNAGAHNVNVFDNTIQECHGQHAEYYLATGGVAGTLIPGEELVQAVSGAKGQYTHQSGSNVYLYRTTTADFIDGQQVTGQTSGASFTVTNYWKGKSHGEGIYIWPGSDNMQVRRNYINPNKATDKLDCGSGTYAISVVGGASGGAIANLVIADNLLVSAKTGEGVLKIYGTSSCDIINNTVIGGDFASFKNYASIYILPGAVPTIIDNFYNNICKLVYSGTEIKNHGNNIFSNNPDGMGSGAYVFTVNGTELVNQNIWSSYFTDYDNLDFTLVAGSNAIDFANASHASVTDVLGVSRVFPPDAGCYEYVSGSPDNTPPLPPTNLISTAQTENSISLSWTAPGPASDGDLASSYKVYRNGTLVSTITNTSFQDSGLAAGISYDYKVYSVDDAGNKSTSAATGTFSTLADTTPPVISSVQTSNVTASQATITWNTNENSTSQVEYGLSASYGNTTNLNSTLVTSHSVVLTWLSPSTTYHYRVKSKDASGNESISQDDTFTTTGVKCSLTVSSTIGGSVTTPGEPGPYQYDQGTEVSIEATEDPNYRFVNWTGTAVNAGKVANPDSASTTVTMDADYTIQANFVVDETDETDPEVTNLSPLADSIQVPLNTLITLDITDSGDGIDPDLVTIKVNNITVYTGDTTDYNSVSGHCYRTGTNANYRFIYQSEQNFDYDQTINITVNATDLASNGMDEYSYSFTTEMRSFGDNIKVNSNTLSSNSMPVTVRDSGGNIWTAWHTGTTGSRDICIGTLTAEAESFSNITKIRDNTTDQCNPAIAVDSDDKLYVAWQDNRRGNWDIYISTSNDGTNWSAETRITDSNDNQINPAIVVNSSNNAYIVWEDDRNGNDNQDIYVATSNNDFVTKTIAQITSDSSNQAEPAIAADSANTIYIVWTDTRNSKNDIYGAASNNGPWTNIPIVNTGDSQSSPAIAAEAVGSILHLVWVDDRPGDDDIYYAQTDGGLPGSPLTGSSIIDDPDEDQLNPVVAVTGSTGSDLQVFVCWQDERNADDDLYLVEISSGSGTNVFVGDDNTNSGQDDPAIGIDGDGHPYLVWTDSRNTNTDIYYAGSTFAESTVLASNNISTSSTVTVGTPLNAINSVDDVSVVVPAGAYPCDIEIIISKITNPLAFAMQCLGAYDFGPSGIDFSQSVTVTIPYNYTGSEDVALAYWYNSLTDALSQQGITDVETIEVSSSLHALRFKTTHFTPFYVFLVSTGGAAASGGGGGGGCSMSPDSQASVVELILPYIGLTVAMVVLKMRDRRKRKALNITKSEC